MSPLRVQCETCGTRLRVRDPGFVGEVHACPRCGSMVLITAPGLIENHAPEIPPSAAEAPLEAEPQIEVATAPPSEQPAPADAPIEAANAAANYAHALAPAITAAALAATAGILWIAYGGEPGAEDEPVAVARDADRAPKTVDPITKEPMLSGPDGGAKRLEPEPAPLPAEALAAEPVDAAPPKPKAEADPVTEPVEPIRLASATVAERSEPETTFRELPEAFDPLDFDPDTIDLVLRRDGAPSTPIPTQEAQEPVVDEPAPSVVEAIDDRLAVAARVGGVSVRRGPTIDPKNRPPETAADRLLAVTLPAIELTKIPLIDAVDLLAELSGAPITVRPDALLHAGVDARREIDIAGEETAFADLIGSTFRKVRLDLKTDGPHATLTRLGSAKSRTVKHRVGDLIGDDPEGLTALLETVGPVELPPIAIESGRVPLEASGATHFELLLLCERLRVARGLSTQTKYPRRLLQTRPSLELVAKTLQRRTTFSFVRPTALRDVVAHWRRSTGRVVLVDWRSLGDLGLGPRSTIECSVTNRPWAKALDGVLEPLGLGWAAVGESLWISSAATLDATTLVDFYPVEAVRGADFAARLAERLASSGVAHDTDGRVTIVRGTAAAQRAAYAEWRGQSQAGR